ncbi:MAG: SCO family protein [Rhodanobacteraceae bacterium]|nr:SCO family protein [Rhodanobacteraceae bacterium]
MPTLESMKPARHALILTAAAALALLWLGRANQDSDLWEQAPAEVQAVLWPVPRPVAGFNLVDQHGQSFAAEDLRGHWSLMYFGYLQCPDVCPTTLQALRGVQRLQATQPDARVTRHVFVSVDPANDSPERIAAYLGYFGDAFTGLAGNPAELQKLTDSLGVIHAEHVDQAGVRSIDHTTAIIVVDPEGRGVGALTAPHDPASMLQRLRALQEYLSR